MYGFVRPMGLLLLLAGCAANPPAPVDVWFPQAVHDGIYDSQARAEVATAPDCPPAGPGTLEIGDATLVYGLDSATVFVVPLPPDGRLHVTNGPAVLDGTLKGDRLAFTVSKPGCRVRYETARLSGF